MGGDWALRAVLKISAVLLGNNASFPVPEHKSSVLLGMYNFALESDVLIETPKT